MHTWNCSDCDMPMTLLENVTNVTCPNCGKRMFEVVLETFENDINNLDKRIEQSIKETNFTRLKHTSDIRQALDEASIVAITDSKGIITYANKKFCKISKYSEEELLGTNHRILKSGYHSKNFYSKLWKTISNGKTWHGDIKNKAKDGTFYWVRTTITPVFDEQQNIKNFISIRTDITSQVELREKLIQSEKMSVIGQLSSNMAHDIRNPLAVIKATFDVMKEQKKDQLSQENLEKFDRIELAIQRISHQIDHVLNFIKPQPAKLNKVRISKIIAESLDSLNVPNDIKIILPKNDAELFCDKKQFVAVINNLILNAIQSIVGKGTIEITVEENDDTIVIQVKDSGKGIPKKNLDKIFEPLFTTKQEGTGLGLAGVKSIINLHAGKIFVTSPPTIFTITLPKNPKISKNS